MRVRSLAVCSLDRRVTEGEGVFRVVCGRNGYIRRMICKKCLVSGRVQGVFYRGAAAQRARELGVRGYARNLPDGRVEVLACGDEEAVQTFVSWLWIGSSAAKVSAVEVVDAPERSRFEVLVDGALAGFTQYRDRGNGVLAFPHTEIDPEFRGRGLATQLVQEALDDVRARGKQIRATCSIVLRFLAEHPEYQDLVAA